jgi:hypothetical protein
LLRRLKEGETLVGHSVDTIVIEDGEGMPLRVNAATLYIRRSTDDERFPGHPRYDYGVRYAGDDGERYMIDGMSPQGFSGIARRMSTIYEAEYGPLLWEAEEGDIYQIIIDSVYRDVPAGIREYEATVNEMRMMKKHGRALEAKEAVA